MPRRTLVWLSVAVTMLSAASGEDYRVEKNVMVPMRDGVKLATDIYLPAAPGKYPVIVYRSPYNKNGERTDGIYFSQHGYVVVAQDCRGRFASQGNFYLLLNEGKDGYDTIEWAAAQPWSNGKVGTAGASYLAWVQYNAAEQQPPHLSAMFALVGGSNFYKSAYPGGVPGLNGPTWILHMAESSPEASRMPELHRQLSDIMQNINPWLALSPQRRGEIFRKLPSYWKMYEDLYAHPSFDSYWKQQGLYPAGNWDKMKDIPMFFLSGWYDPFDDGVIENYLGLSRIQKSMKRLMMGPWPHPTGRAELGDAYFGPSAAVDQRALELDWFDHWMKGTPFRMVGSQPVKIFRMGGGVGTRTSNGLLYHGGKWISLPSWPPPEVRSVKYYVHSGDFLGSVPGTNEEASRFDYDPVNPVPTMGGRYGKDSVQNQGGIEKRKDVLSFSTTSLRTGVDVTGRVRARLWVSSDAPETDFAARLTDVYPDGYSLIVADGQVRTWAKPGTVHEVEIDLGSTSNLFVPGHRIRLDITSSNFPKLQPNSRAARNTVFHDTGHPSYLELPVVHR